MPDRVLIDTNVILDLIDAGRPCHDDAIALFSNDDIDICVVVSSLKDTYYVLRKIYQDERRARVDVATVMGAVTVLDLTAYDASVAIDSDEPDFEDGLVRSVAESNEVDLILTRDAAAFGKSCVKKLTPQEFVAQTRR